MFILTSYVVMFLLQASDSCFQTRFFVFSPLVLCICFLQQFQTKGKELAVEPSAQTQDGYHVKVDLKLNTCFRYSS